MERFPDGSPGAERRLTRAAERVHRLVGEIETAPTDAAIKRLDRAFRALVRSGEEARAAGVPASRVDDKVERARDRCRALLLDVLVPLVARKDAVCDVSRARTAHYLKGVDGV